MTDISESGIEAAAKAIFDTWAAIKGSDMSWTEAIAAADRPNVYPEMAAIVPLCRAEANSAIQAYLPFHPPASREEGLTVKALEWAGTVGWLKADRYSITTYLGMDRPYKLEGHLPFSEHFDTLEAAKSAAQEDYQNRVLSAIETALIPTKPEAKEDYSDTIAWLRDDAERRTEGIVGNNGRLKPEQTHQWRAAEALSRISAALQSKKPE